MRRDTLLYKKKPKNKRLEFWGQIGDALVSKYTVDLAKIGECALFASYKSFVAELQQEQRFLLPSGI